MFEIADIIYTDVVEAVLTCEPEKTLELQGIMNNLTGGKAILKEEKVRIVRKKL